MSCERWRGRIYRGLTITSPTPAIHRQCYSADSIASTAASLVRRMATITANTGLFSIERDQEKIDDSTPYGHRGPLRPSDAAPAGGRRSRRDAGRLLSAELDAKRLRT